MRKETSWRRIDEAPPFLGRRSAVLMFSRELAELECYPGHPVEIESARSFAGERAQGSGYTHWWGLPAIPGRNGPGGWKPLADTEGMPPDDAMASVLLYRPKPREPFLQNVEVSNTAYIRAGNAGRDGFTHWHPVPGLPEKIGPKTRPCAECRERDHLVRKALARTAARKTRKGKPKATAGKD